MDICFEELFTTSLFAGVAGVFTIFSSFVFSIAVINLVGSDLTGLKYVQNLF